MSWPFHQQVDNVCFPSLVTFAGTSSPCASLSSDSLFQASFSTALGILPTFVSGFVCAFPQVFPLGLSAAVGTAGSSPCSGVSGDVPRASAEQPQGAGSCPHQPRRSLQPWGSPGGSGFIVEGQNHLRFHVFHPLPGSNSCGGASPTGVPLQPE